MLLLLEGNVPVKSRWKEKVRLWKPICELYHGVLLGVM